MTYSLWLDDLRPIPEGFDNWSPDFEHACCLVKEKGIPNYISFDHDLGPGKMTGYDFAKYLCMLDYCGYAKFPKDFSFGVHSANPTGQKNIEGYLFGYFMSQRLPK